MRKTNVVADAFLWGGLLAGLFAACDAIEQRAGAQPGSPSLVVPRQANALPGQGPSPHRAPMQRRPLVLDLSRCAVGEAGWAASPEHASIWWVVRKRHVQAVKRWPLLRVEHVLGRYCKALSGGRVWLRELAGVHMPEHWPGVAASWPRHRSLWLEVVSQAEQFVLGKLPDPCPEAMHWGGPPGVDKPCQGCVQVDCGITLNRFYRVRGKHE